MSTRNADVIATSAGVQLNIFAAAFAAYRGDDWVSNGWFHVATAAGSGPHPRRGLRARSLPSYRPGISTSPKEYRRTSRSFGCLTRARESLSASSPRRRKSVTRGPPKLSVSQPTTPVPPSKRMRGDCGSCRVNFACRRRTDHEFVAGAVHRRSVRTRMGVMPFRRPLPDSIFR